MKRWNVLIGLILALGMAESTWAGDLEWSGVYRIEGLTIENPLLKGGVKKSKDYGVHQLILRPKIVAGDGLYISGQLNVFNSHADNNGTWGNQLGAIFGGGLGGGGGAEPSHSGNSNTLGERQDEELITLSQFYLTHVQQYGSLLVGRAPVHFGLGMVHNAGRGLFDHYADTRDLVGYKITMGNFYLFPMYAKVNEGALSGYDDVKEWLVQLEYDNPESATKMGLMYWDRSAHLTGNDSTNPNGGPYGAAVPTGDYKYKLFSIFFAREFENFSIGLEVANQSGKSGSVKNSIPVDISGMGAALEAEYKPKDKKWRAGIKAGWATGDDPTTAEYEGFVFDRNYDVAMMLFNHAMGQANFLHTQINGTSFPADGGTSPLDAPDVEAISNVMYLSPYFRYQWKDQWSFGLSVTTSWLDRTELTNPNVDGDNGLGYEVDLSLNYSPNERVVWQNTFGWLTPGAAFEANNSFSTSAAYGFLSRAAISF